MDDHKAKSNIWISVMRSKIHDFATNPRLKGDRIAVAVVAIFVLLGIGYGIGTASSQAHISSLTSQVNHLTRKSGAESKQLKELKDENASLQIDAQKMQDDLHQISDKKNDLQKQVSDLKKKNIDLHVQLTKAQSVDKSSSPVNSQEQAASTPAGANAGGNA